MTITGSQENPILHGAQTAVELAVSSPNIRWLVFLTVIAIAVVLSACSDSAFPTLEPTVSATSTPGPGPTATTTPEPARSMPEPTAMATVTVSPEPAATATPEPTRPMPEPTSTATATPSPEPTATATPEPARPAAVMVSPTTAELTALGATAQLGAEVRDQGSNVMTGVTVTWTTSANLVATVDALGVVTAVGNGTATITASAGSASGSAVVTVAQEVASVEVLPSIAELTAWGETVQLVAEALDANGHTVAVAEFSWESADALVAEVDALGLVSGTAEGEATITASAGAASGSALVAVPPTFTLSGTVRDSRESGPTLAGAVVRLENGKRESMVVGPDGGYRFPNVWGTVTVRVIAWPTHGTETFEIAMDEDRTLDFNLEHTGTPPWRGAFSPPPVIEPSDPTRLGSITYVGRGERRTQGDGPGLITINAYLFDVRYEGQVVEFRVHPEFGSREAAQAEVETFAHVLGQMPTVLMPRIKHVVIHAGEGRWGATRDGILVYTGGSDSSRYEETFVHEGTHVNLQAHNSSPGWRAAQEADGVFISNYARDNPNREDVAESFVAWFAVRYRPERLSAGRQPIILRTIPNRLIYFDEQGFDMSPYTPSDVQYPSEVTIQGKVIGPDNQPLEGIFVHARSGSGNFMGRVLSEEDGMFVRVVPDGSYVLEVFAPNAERNTWSFVGWHGPGGFTTIQGDATLFKLDGESALDIVIRLPDHPYALPRIEWHA